MNAQRMTFVVLVVGILAAGFVGHGLAQTSTQRSSPPPAWDQRWDRAYLTIDLESQDWTTVLNPRADEGLTFYITDVFCTGYRLSVKLPPELGYERTLLEILVWTGDGTMEVSGLFALSTCIPFTTTLDIKKDREGSPGVPKAVVLNGYYGPPPIIEQMEVAEGG